MLALAWRYRSGCASLLLLQLLLLGLGLLGLTLTGLAVDTMRHWASSGAQPSGWPLGVTFPEDWSPVAITAALASGVLIAAVLRSAVSYWYAITAARLVHQRIVVDLRSQVYEKLQRLSFRFFHVHNSGSIIGRVTSDVQSLRVFVDGVVLQLFVLLLSLGMYLIYMLRIHVGLTIVCLSTTPLLWLLSASFSRVVRPAYDRNRELVDQMLLALTENARGMQVVKSFDRHREEVHKFRRANRAVKSQQQWIFWRVSLFTPSIELLTSLNQAALLAYGGYLVIQNQLPLGTGLIVFSGLLQQFSGQVSKVTNLVNSVQQSFTGARRVFEILDAPVEIASCKNARRLPKVQGAVRFENVCFGYKPGDEVLRNISFEARAGQCVAILGTTGQGKTSLLNLIPRFYDVASGRVLVDGIDVRTLDLNDLRRNVGIVFQENILFSDTVAANIAFGFPQATPTQIERAARIAAAHDFILRLPQGYNTVLRENGKDLSGGQRQRLAIARALLLEPPILLLDDPTAAIDARTEDEILRAMHQAMQGRTTFVVAHRLSTLRRADLVLVLDGGSIVEAGSHQQLMAAGGAYWRAATLQGAGDGPHGDVPSASKRERVPMSVPA
jgi:ATP-binding cassette subfamily B protein